jgi:CDP-diacylglycerol---serine O-phosphatidyltransferase
MIRKNIPNAITCANLLCGCLAIVRTFQGDLIWAAYLVGIATVLDFLDGFAARLLNETSPIGKDLDSLADVVTFGVVPGLIMFQMITFDTATDSGYRSYLPYVAFMIPVFSAVRLAIFNNDARQTDSFVGLPTPANAILISSLPLIVLNQLPDQTTYAGIFAATVNSSEIPMLAQANVLAALSVVQSLLLVAPIPLFALKFKHFKWKENEIRFLFLLWTVILITFLQVAGIPLIILSYVLFSLIQLAVQSRGS